MARSDRLVRTVQLYRGDDEQHVPVVSIHGGTPLTLEFDLLEREGRPLSVYFVHADRTWSADLSPSQAFETYSDDTLLDYQSSQGTDVDYVHYRYRFPNDDLQFRVSGNYVLRVTEKGKRNAVLFERAFYVTEQKGSLTTGLQSVPVRGRSRSAVRPIARYEPPPHLRANPSDYAACFVRAGHRSDTRCSERPLLMDQPRLVFELEERLAFAPTFRDYVLDVGQPRSGQRILRTDASTSPVEVYLEADHAHLDGPRLGAGLTGQTVIRQAVPNRADPSVTGEYMRVQFAFVPPNGRPFGDAVRLVGSFAGMSPSNGYEMDWNPAPKRYEVSLLLKKGRYQYFYQLSESDRSSYTHRTSGELSRHVFTTLVYYRDPARNTDRLLRVGQVTP